MLDAHVLDKLCALMMIKNPNPPSSLGITDFGFNIPWASVLLVLKFMIEDM